MEIEKHFSPEVEIDSFSNKKKDVLKFLEEEKKGEKVGSGWGENAGQLDENIRELVNKLNQLPFLRTRESCGGEILTRESIIKKTKDVRGFNDLDENSLYLPNEGKVFYSAGWLDFYIKESEQSNLFIDKLRKLTERFGGSLSNRLVQEQKRPGGIFYMLGLGKNAFGGSLNTDPQETKEREAKREEFKLEILKLVDEFMI